MRIECYRNLFSKSISKCLGCCISSKKFVWLGGAHSTLHWWQCIEWLVSWSVEQFQHGETSNNLGVVHGNLLRGIDKKTVRKLGISIFSLMFSFQ